MFDAILELVKQWGSLIGVAAGIAVLINIAKELGWVKDGKAQMWSVVLNIVAMGVMIGLKVFVPSMNIPDVDDKLIVVAEALTVLLGYIVQLASSKVSYEQALKGVPLIGKSFSAPK